MKLTIEPSSECLKIEGQPLRIWTGTDENGTPVKVYVRTIAVETDDPERLAAFEAELEALPPLMPGAIDFRFIA